MNSDTTPSPPESGHPESGNVVFFILLAVVLLGLVTVALRSGGDGSSIDKESTLVAASQVKQYASEIERGVAFIMREGISESAIRFADDTGSEYGNISASPQTQVFSESGGGVAYRQPPPDISSAARWEFYGHTHLPGVGTAEPELIAVLPHVSKMFCERINAMNSYDPATQPTDTDGDCLNAADDDVALRFTSANTYSTGVGIDITDEATFTVVPAMEGCVECADHNSDTLPDYHFFHVLIAR